MGYGLVNSMWPGKTTLTWRLVQGTSSARLDQAFSTWSVPLGIRFERVLVDNTTVDFKVAAGAGSTGWSPSIKTMHLKDGEPFGVILHEIGHLLGLSHEQDREDQRENFYAKMTDWHLQGAVTRAKKLKAYGNYDAGSIMLYPDSNYKDMLSPSAGDFQAVKAINGWG